MDYPLKCDIIKNYHEETKHSYWSVRNNMYHLDVDNRPFCYKQYYDVKKIDLFLPYENQAADTLSSLVHSAAVPEKHDFPITLAALSELFQTAYGLTAKRTDDIGMPFYLRSAPSAGALYPVEVYAVVRGASDLPDGLYHYSVFDFTLALLKEGTWASALDGWTYPWRHIGESSIIFIFTSIFWRSAWKYRDRAYRYLLEDSGHVAANFLVVCSSLGMKAQLISDFSDDDVSSFLHIDKQQEVPLLLIAAGSHIRDQSVAAVHKKERSAEESIQFHTNSIAEQIISLPHIYKVHEATSQDRDCFMQDYRVQQMPVQHSDAVPRVPWKMEEQSCVTLPPPDLEKKKTVLLPATLLQRRSCRKYADEPIPLEDLATLLYASTQVYNTDILVNNDIVSGVDENNNGFIDVCMVANDIQLLSKGLYYYDKNTQRLVPIKHGDFRRQVTCLCLEQEFIDNAAAVFFLSCSSKDIFNLFGPRGYRVAFLCSGIIAEFLYLAGDVLGLGVTTVGSFYDDDIVDFLGLPHNDTIVMLAVIVGIRARRKK